MDSPNTSSPFSGNSSTEPNESQKNLELTKNKVDEVVDIMRQNVQKIVDRGENLAEVDNRTEALRNSAMQFQSHSQKLQQKQWWANTKMKIALGVVGVILIIIIIVWIAS
ncbi:vesicle-associated membrane protein 3-like [Bradysia coprophila]|uniref:vesicle-associated membrane protein 3-like n=1 Tax=Bradysia coprophila TaxID=38358 RepID=UPI00187DAA62|nr:vesicle-associated membrane protein 3-like [Bradysia coprophila]